MYASTLLRLFYVKEMWRERARLAGCRGPIRVSLVLGSSLLASPISAELERGRDPDTGLLSWTWRHRGVSVQLVQRLPDQTRAFFLARGFNAEAADLIARACVFQTIFRNDGERPVTYDLGEWTVHHQGEELGLRTREVWDREWQAQGIDQPARIAFRWSLLPTVQRFEPGDYNWGMTSFGMAPGERFDLSLRTVVDGQAIVDTISAVICAPDR